MLTDERIDELAYGTRDFDFNRFARAIEAEVLAEVCSAQNSEYAPQDCLSLTDATQVRMEAQPVAYVMTEEEQSRTTLKTPIIVLGNLPRGANLFASQQPPAPCQKCAELELKVKSISSETLAKERQTADGFWSLYQTEKAANKILQAKVAELEKFQEDAFAAHPNLDLDIEAFNQRGN